jgi:hypothetical protein
MTSIWRSVGLLVLLVSSTGACTRSDEPNRPKQTPSPQGPNPTDAPVKTLAVAVPEEPLSPNAPFSLTFAEPVRNRTALKPEITVAGKAVAFKSEWQTGNEELKITPTQALPLGIEVRVVVKGAKSLAGVSFADVDVKIPTKRNPTTRTLLYSAANTLERSFSYLIDEEGRVIYGLNTPAGSMTATECTHLTWDDDGALETTVFSGAGADGMLCTGDDETLTDYRYNLNTETQIAYGRSSSLGDDEKPRTADDGDPTYRLITREAGKDTDCTSTGAGADEVYLTSDDVTTCTCKLDDAMPPSGVQRRTWKTPVGCNQAAAESYCDEAAPQKEGDGSLQETVCRRATQPGIASSGDVVVSTVRVQKNAFGQEVLREDTSIGISSERDVTTYDELGNRLSRTRLTAGADLQWNTADDGTQQEDLFDPNL